MQNLHDFIQAANLDQQRQWELRLAYLNAVATLMGPMVGVEYLRALDACEGDNGDFDLHMNRTAGLAASAANALFQVAGFRR